MNCPFCEIVAGRVPSEKVYDDDQVMAFRDISPQAPVHILVVPKDHADGIASMDGNDKSLIGDVMLAAAAIARSEGIAESGYRLVVNQGGDGGQTVGHLHVHLLGGRQMNWPPG